MLILFGSDGNNLESFVSRRFGHSDYYLIYNLKENNFQSFRNNREEHDHNNLHRFVDIGVEAFIVGNIGPGAFNIVNSHKSKVYLARNLSVKEALEKFLKNELTLLTKPTAKKSIRHEHK